MILSPAVVISAILQDLQESREWERVVLRAAFGMQRNQQSLAFLLARGRSGESNRLSSKCLATSSFLLLVVMPGATSSFLLELLLVAYCY